MTTDLVLKLGMEKFWPKKKKKVDSFQLHAQVYPTMAIDWKSTETTSGFLYSCILF